MSNSGVSSSVSNSVVSSSVSDLVGISGSVGAFINGSPVWSSKYSMPISSPVRIITTDKLVYSFGMASKCEGCSTSEMPAYLIPIIIILLKIIRGFVCGKSYEKNPPLFHYYTSSYL